MKVHQLKIRPLAERSIFDSFLKSIVLKSYIIGQILKNCLLLAIFLVLLFSKFLMILY